MFNNAEPYSPFCSIRDQVKLDIEEDADQLLIKSDCFTKTRDGSDRQAQSGV